MGARDDGVLSDCGRMARELGGRVIAEAVRGVITDEREGLAFASRRSAPRVPLGHDLA